MIKVILFDLDGVLVESTKKLHFEALNKALQNVSDTFVISEEDHHKIFDGLSTKNKLSILNSTRGLPQNLNISIEEDKQNITWKMLEELEYSTDKLDVLSKLKKHYALGLCTNSISKTTEIILSKLQVKSLFDIILTNEDVEFPKPSPEIYKKAMNILGVTPEETVILEDSPTGLRAAFESGANVMRVNHVSDVNICKINRFISSINKLDSCLNKHSHFKQFVIRKNIRQQKGHYQSEILCQSCNNTRFVNNHNLRAQIEKNVFTAMCRNCNPSAFQNGKSHRFYNAEKRSTHGYKILNVSELNDEDRALASSMSWKSANKPEYVFEHRLVMARKLKRPLLQTEIVHHKNGKKDDNRIENLHLLTIKTHHSGHGDDFYQKWQEAETEIRNLKENL